MRTLNLSTSILAFLFLAYFGDANPPEYPDVYQDAAKASKFPDGCKRIITKVKCSYPRCQAKASLGDCVLIHKDLALINRTYPQEDSNCRPEEKLCVKVTNNDNITIYGTLGVLPTTVYVQLNYVRRNITFEFVAGGVQSAVDYSDDVFYPHHPIVNQEPGKASKFPVGCKRLITEVKCTLPHCQAKANLGDCVLIHKYMTPVNRTNPPEDPNCRPEEKLCVKVTNNVDVTIYGTLGVLPTTVYVQLNYVRRNVTFEFLAKDKSKADYPGNVNYPQYPIVNKDAGQASKFPEGCKRIIFGTEVTCKFGRCKAKASLGDCVLVHQYIAPINRTYPPEDPNCRPEEKLCVKVTNNDNITIYGTLGVLPTTVYVQLNDLSRNITFEFLAKDKSEADYPGDVNYPQYPNVNQDAVQASKFPEGCKRIIYGTEVTCKFGRCKAKASLGDCVLVHQYIAPINRTYPPEDPNCRPEQTLCVNVTNNDNITIYGTLGVLPTTVYVQLNDLSRNITFEFLVQDMIATENLPTTTRVSAASSLSGVGSPTSTDAKADSVSNGTTQLQGEGGKTTSVSAATDGVTVLTFALLVLSALLK